MSTTALMSVSPLGNRNGRLQKTKKRSLRIKSHEAPPVTARPKRKRITPEQFRALSDLFDKTDTPSYELREEMAQQLSMTNREVQVWFQNRRAKMNRAKALEQMSHKPTLHRSCPDQGSADTSTYQPICNVYRPWSPSPPPFDMSPCSSSTSASSVSTPTWHYMTPIDILATAAEYVQRCDEEERAAKRRSELAEHKSWRPWL